MTPPDETTPATTPATTSQKLYGLKLTLEKFEQGSSASVPQHRITVETNNLTLSEAIDTQKPFLAALSQVLEADAE